MKSDLHETFRITSWGSPKMIHDVRNDPILHVSSQEPSTSTKYGLQGRGVLDTLLIKLETWNLAHKLRITYHEDPWCQESPHPSKYPVRNYKRPSSMTSRTGGSWHTFIHARVLRIGTQVRSHISWWYMVSRMTLSSRYLIRNHQHPQGIDIKDKGFLTHF